MILISRTFETVTPESAEDGEVAESGFVSISEPVSFRELVSLMCDHPVPSCYPPRGEAFEWLSTYGEESFRDGYEVRTESLHFGRSNPPRRLKYWRKAMIAAGIIRPRRVESVPRYVNQVTDMGVTSPLSRSIRVF